MGLLTNLEASLFRYMHETLEVPYGIKLFEDINSEDTDNYTKWIVIDTLSNNLGGQPKQLYFLHIAQHRSTVNPKDALTRLVDTVIEALDEGTEITLYDYDTATAIGVMTVSTVSISKVLRHAGGGSKRTLSVGITYPGN